ncbi:hypothetical protein MRX96_026813 [Rhipicephalus microplus]
MTAPSESATSSRHAVSPHPTSAATPTTATSHSLVRNSPVSALPPQTSSGWFISSELLYRCRSLRGIHVLRAHVRGRVLANFADVLWCHYDGRAHHVMCAACALLGLYRSLGKQEDLPLGNTLEVLFVSLVILAERR